MCKSQKVKGKKQTKDSDTSRKRRLANKEMERNTHD